MVSLFIKRVVLSHMLNISFCHEAENSRRQLKYKFDKKFSKPPGWIRTHDIDTLMPCLQQNVALGLPVFD